MSNETKVTLCKGGTEERTLPLSKIIIPDMWHISETIRKRGSVANPEASANTVLECWRIAHDLKRHIQES